MGEEEEEVEMIFKNLACFNCQGLLLSSIHWLSPTSVPYRLYNEKLLLGLEQDLTKQGNNDKC